MTQSPPPVPPPVFTYSPQPQQRPANVWAIVSLICGIIGCLVITPFVAIVTGFVGVGQSRRLGGRGMAIAGIILGLLWIVGAVGIGGATYWGVNKVVALAKQPAIDTINALADGDPTKAKNFSTLTDDEAAALSDRLKSYGKCTNLSVSSFNAAETNGVQEIHISGTATFDVAGEKGFSAKIGNLTSGSAVRVTELSVN